MSMFPLEIERKMDPYSWIFGMRVHEIYGFGFIYCTNTCPYSYKHVSVRLQMRVRTPYKHVFIQLQTRVCRGFKYVFLEAVNVCR